MFYNQPIAHRFGRSLVSDIDSGGWKDLEFAVAWVRQSGTRHVATPLRRFLQRGGRVQVTVGIDIENTSREGLEALLGLERDGAIETTVHHNEANPTFHPKVYLLQNLSAARLIVGSNNLTEAGLFVNTEAGLQIDTHPDDKVVLDARSALAEWRDPRTGFAHVLNDSFLDALTAAGYVLRESELRVRRKTSEARRRVESGTNERLFRSERVSVPSIEEADSAVTDGPGAVLLMRVRRASESARRTQVQIPIRLARSPFFGSITKIESETSGAARELRPARARNGLNTIKLELPEIDSLADPVVRFQRRGDTISYRAFDSSSVLGAPIRSALLRGFDATPAQTMTSTQDLHRATWWRFI